MDKEEDTKIASRKKIPTYIIIQVVYKDKIHTVYSNIIGHFVFSYLNSILTKYSILKKGYFS